MKRAFSDERFAIFMVTALCAASLAGCATDGGPRILSQYNSMVGVRGMRPYPHMGVDIDAAKGDPVIAAADGTVVELLSGDAMCGNGVILRHELDKTPLGWTRYCHMDETGVQEGQKIERGDVLGKVGTTGNSLGIPHLHLELCPDRPCRGFMRDTADPLPLVVGCFDPGAGVPSVAKDSAGKPRLVLTYPVRCSVRKKAAPV